MKRFLPILLLLAAPALGQITVAPNTPTYGFQVLPGSVREVNLQILSGGTQCATGGGNTCLVNWSVTGTTGGASATFTSPTHTAASSLSADLPVVAVNIGSTGGSCTITPASGSGTGVTYSVSSTATVTVTAQSTDTGTPSTTILFNICTVPYSSGLLANGINPVVVAPAYQQAYANAPTTLQSWVIGQTNQNVTWSIASQPGGGNGALADTSNRDTVFTASVPGEYTIDATSVANGALVGSAIIYISSDSVPSYAATPNGTKPLPCDVDSTAFSHDYEVGAGKTYTTINGAPLINTWAAGTIMRIWNTDTTGLSPSTFHEYYQVEKSGTASNPIMICGVPDSLGNLPIIDGSNANGQSGI
jgi:hypothetical protein